MIPALERLRQDKCDHKCEAGLGCTFDSVSKEQKQKKTSVISPPHLGALWSPSAGLPGRPQSFLTMALLSPDWMPGMAVPQDIAAEYLLQGSFYGHSVYATLYMDTWRRDSVVMLAHHVVTLALIICSYAFR